MILVWINLSDNQVKKIDGLSELRKLKELSLSHIWIVKVEGQKINQAQDFEIG